MSNALNGPLPTPAALITWDGSTAPNGNREHPLATVVVAANAAMFTLSLTLDDFSYPKPVPAKKA